MESKFLQIKSKDLVKGFITAILLAILTGLYSSINEGTFPPSVEGWKAMGVTALGGGIAYLLKNWLTNSDDQFLKKEISNDLNKPDL